MARFINRKINPPIKRQALTTTRIRVNGNSIQEKVNENKEEKIEDMTTQDKIEQASKILGSSVNAQPKVKRIKSDKGLIERTESSKIIITEDNKELLND